MYMYLILWLSQKRAGAGVTAHSLVLCVRVDGMHCTDCCPVNFPRAFQIKKLKSRVPKATWRSNTSVTSCHDTGASWQKRERRSLVITAGTRTGAARTQRTENTCTQQREVEEIWKKFISQKSRSRFRKFLNEGALSFPPLSGQAAFTNWKGQKREIRQEQN